MLKCPKCSYEFEWKFQVDHHVQRDHENVYAAELFHAIVEPEQFRCICCKFKGYYDWDLYEHCKQEHHGRIIDGCKNPSSFCDENDDDYPCDRCCAAYKSDSSLVLLKHANSCRPPSVIESNGTKKHFPCSQCSYKTTREDDLRTHVVLKHASDSSCDQLADETATNEMAGDKLPSNCNGVEQEQQTKDSEYAAECSYETNQISHLINHIMQQASSVEIDRFECAQCSFKTVNTEHFIKHMLRHASGDRFV